MIAMDMEKPKPSLDIFDLCGILQTVGFVLRDENISPKPKVVGRSIEITCNVSGRKALLESNSADCYCWCHGGQRDVELWETCGTSGGVQTTKMESRTANWKELPKNRISYIEKTMESLVEIVRDTTHILRTPPRERKNSITLNNIDAKLNKIKAECNLNLDDATGHIVRSSSNIDSSPTKMLRQIKTVTPNRYRSLDTLTGVEKNPALPEPGVLSADKKLTCMVGRQNTYTTSPTLDVCAGAVRDAIPARTSSSVSSRDKIALNKLNEAVRLYEDLGAIIKETKTLFEDEHTHSASGSVMDVSKISDLKGSEKRSGRISHSSPYLSKNSGMPYASSPNLSRVQESRIPYNNLKRIKSVSTNKINSPNLPTHSEVVKTNSLKRGIPKKLSSIASISPSFGAMAGRKSLGYGSVVGNQLPGTYKSLGDKAPLRSPNLCKDGETKKRISVYSINKPVLARTPSAKK